MQQDRERTAHRRLFAHNDAWSPHFDYGPTTAEEIRRQIEPFRDTDFSRLYWEAGGGDLLQYFTAVGRLHTYEEMDDFGRPGERLVGESWRSLRDQGLDPLRVAIDYAHAIGLELHAGYRVANFHSPAPQDHFSMGDSFYRRHPELRGEDRNGNRTTRIAFTYSERREFVVSVLREIAGYPVDGICILYNRRPPIVEYEPPLVDGFKAEYGEDPRQLDPHDRRWLCYRARVLTGFMRDVRRAMDAASEERGWDKRIEVSVFVLRNEEENLFYGMDLKAWVDERLVDTLILYSSQPNFDADTESRGEAWADVRDLDYFLSLTRGTGCKVAFNVMPRRMSPEAYRNRARALYDAGVENLFFWDSDAGNRADFGASWGALRRLGHRDELDAWARAGSPSLALATMAVRRLGDFDVAYETPE